MSEQPLNQELSAAEVLYPDPVVEEVAAAPVVEEIVQPEKVAETNTETVADAPVEQTETSEEVQTESTESKPTEVEAEAGEQISSFAQLVENQGWEPEWANNLKIPVKVDGETSEASIADLVSNFQIGEAATKRLDDAKVKAQSITQEATQYGDVAKGQLAQAAGLVQLAEKLFNMEAEEANLANLRETDPTQYLVAKDQLAERRRTIDVVRAEAQKVFQTAAEQVNAPMNAEEKTERIALEHGKLLDRIPAWKDDSELAQTESTELVQYLSDNYEYSQEDIGEALDHRLFDLSRKAMLYDRHIASVETAKKKVVTIPTIKGAAESPAASGPKDAADVLYPNG